MQVMVTSDFGVTWTGYKSSDETVSWYSVTYGAGLFVAVGDTYGLGGNAIMTSADNGKTWTGRPAPNSDGNAWNSVIYGNGAFVATSRGIRISQAIGHAAMTSPDGITWTGRVIIDLNTYDRDDWDSIAYGNKVFIAVCDGGYYNLERAVVSTNNGATWAGSPTANDDQVTTSWRAVVYGNDLANNGVFGECGGLDLGCEDR